MPSLRIPGNTTNVSDDWNDHRARGSLGGTDFTDGRGTPMHAMAAGVVTIVDNSPDGSGGRYFQIRHDDGTKTEELHALTVTVARGQRVNLGDQCGLSSGSGYGSDYYYGPHIHAHGISAAGVRFNVEPFINWSNPTQPAGTPGGSSPLEDELSAADVADLKAYLEARLMMGIRRDGGQRGRLIHDAGPDGTRAELLSPRAALAAWGYVLPLDSDPGQRAGQLAEYKRTGRGVIIPTTETSAALSSTEFNREVELWGDPDAPFGRLRANWIELDPSQPQTTWQEMTDGRRYPYQSRQAVWADLRPVELRVLGVPVAFGGLFRNGAGFTAKLIDGRTVVLGAAEVARANAQRPLGQTWAIA